MTLTKGISSSNYTSMEKISSSWRRIRFPLLSPPSKYQSRTRIFNQLFTKLSNFVACSAIDQSFPDESSTTELGPRRKMVPGRIELPVGVGNGRSLIFLPLPRPMNADNRKSDKLSGDSAARPFRTYPFGVYEVSPSRKLKKDGGRGNKRGLGNERICHKSRKALSTMSRPDFTRRTR